MIFTIAGKELKTLFLSPLAWAILAVVQAILAYFFLVYLDYYVQIQPQLTTLPNAPGVTNMVVVPLFSTVAVVLLLVVPLLTMRLVSEERRNQTLTLLISAPLSVTQIILGKFTGLMGFLLIMLGLITLMPLSLLMAGSLDMGLLLSGILALVLLLCSFAALGLYLSTLTTQPTVAAIATFGALLLLWILDLAGKTGGDEESVLAYLSMLNHYQPLIRGIFSSADVVYYLLFSALFLILSMRHLDAQRLQQ